MRTLLLGALVLTACGTSPKSVCAELSSSASAFLPAGQDTCVSKDGATTLTVTRWGNNTMQCESAAAKCTTMELATLQTYVSCLSKAPTCTAGAEAKATAAIGACVSELLSHTPGPECVAALK